MSKHGLLRVFLSTLLSLSVLTLANSTFAESSMLGIALSHELVAGRHVLQPPLMIWKLDLTSRL